MCRRSKPRSNGRLRWHRRNTVANTHVDREPDRAAAPRARPHVSLANVLLHVAVFILDIVVRRARARAHAATTAAAAAASASATFAAAAAVRGRLRMHARDDAGPPDALVLVVCVDARALGEQRRRRCGGRGRRLPGGLGAARGRRRRARGLGGVVEQVVLARRVALRDRAEVEWRAHDVEVVRQREHIERLVEPAVMTEGQDDGPCCGYNWSVAHDPAARARGECWQKARLAPPRI